VVGVVSASFALCRTFRASLASLQPSRHRVKSLWNGPPWTASGMSRCRC
jgi:hypothetical protein